LTLRAGGLGGKDRLGADTLEFVRTRSRPWVDSGQDKASDDPYSIQAVGRLSLRLHAAEALQEKAGLAVDAAVAAPDAESVAKAQIAVAEARSSAPKSLSRRPIRCSNRPEPAPPWPTIILTAIGATRGFTPCMIRCAGNTPLSAITC
jgi:hypothetical protein